MPRREITVTSGPYTLQINVEEYPRWHVETLTESIEVDIDPDSDDANKIIALRAHDIGAAVASAMQGDAEDWADAQTDR